MNKALNLASKRFVESGRGIGIITPLLYKVVIVVGRKPVVCVHRAVSACLKGLKRPVLGIP